MQLLRRYWHVAMPYLLDVWPHVLGWSSCAETVGYEADGQACEFTPSFRVTESACSYAVHLDDDLPGDGPRGGKAAARQAAVHGRLSKVFSDRRDHLRFVSRSELEEHPHLAAAKEIFYYRYWDWPLDLPRDAAAMVSRGHAGTLGDIHDLVGAGEAGWCQVLSLVSNGHLDVSLDGGLGRHTPVTGASVAGHG